jgi:hypothetical protein
VQQRDAKLIGMSNQGFVEFLANPAPIWRELATFSPSGDCFDCGLSYNNSLVVHELHEALAGASAFQYLNFLAHGDHFSFADRI